MARARQAFVAGKAGSGQAAQVGQQRVVDRGWGLAVMEQGDAPVSVGNGIGCLQAKRTINSSIAPHLK